MRRSELFDAPAGVQAQLIELPHRADTKGGAA